MTDNDIIKAYEGLTARQQLNFFRNLYYKDGNATENGIVANSITEILIQFHEQKAEIEDLKSENKILKDSNINLQELYENEREKVKKAKEKVINACRELQTAKAEIEKLNKLCEEQKAEAVKEFAEEIKQKTIAMVHSDEVLTTEDYIKCIDEIVKNG